MLILSHLEIMFVVKNTHPDNPFWGGFYEYLFILLV